jgi:hypothetical protein
MVLVKRPDSKSPFGRPKRRVYNTKTDIKERGWNAVDWSLLAEDRKKWPDVVNTVMGLRVLYNPRRYLTSCGNIIFSRSTLLHGIGLVYR